MPDSRMTVRPTPSLLLTLLTCCGGTPYPSLSPAAPPPPVPTAGAASPPAAPSTRTAAPPPDAGLAAQTFQPVPLPGAAAPASLDYLAYEGARGRIWVPVGNTGSVDVYDPSTKSFTRVDGFKTGEREYKGKARTTGPSAVTLGEGFAYVGNRATSEVCPVDTAKLTLGPCVKLASPTDGVAYVAAVKEVWVTTPSARAIVVLDVSRPGMLKPKTRILLDGAPEGYAVDPARGVFFTNLEDRSRTVMLDVKTHRPRASFPVDCGTSGPRGIAADAEHGFVFVACTDRVLVLDGGGGGALVATVDTGPGLDNIDWLAPQRLLFAAAGKAAKLTVARVDSKGQPTVVSTRASVDGARNGVADASGNAYVADPDSARLLVFPSVP
jgi:hypothetical protein